MFQKLEDVEKRYDELKEKISDPEVIAKQSEWQKYMKEHAGMEEVVLKYREYKKAKNDFEEAKAMSSDKELKELAEMEMEELREKIPQLEEELKILLIPKDPDDDKNIICEIRGGAGGEEAALFAGTLFRMYSMYAERKHFQIQVINENDTVAIDELELEVGENDSLAAIVATIAKADLLIIMSDIDGLYNKDPHKEKDAILIPVVNEITDDIRALAGGVTTKFGTGGMVTKLNAVEIAYEAGIDVVIMNGKQPKKLYDLFEDKSTGTLFHCGI